MVFLIQAKFPFTWNIILFYTDKYIYLCTTYCFKIPYAFIFLHYECKMSVFKGSEQKRIWAYFQFFGLQAGWTQRW